MASIRKHRGKWQVQVRRDGSKPVSKTFHLKADAEAWARKMEQEADREGILVDRRPLKATTVDDLLARYVTDVTSRKKSAKTEAGLISQLRRRGFSQKNLMAATAAVFTEYRDKRLQEVSSASVRREFDILHHVFEVAQRDWQVPLSSNPLGEVKKPSSAKARERRLSNTEEKALLDACAKMRNHELLPFVILAIETGMRRSELVSLEWQNVDLSQRVAHLPNTKNGDSRDVPLSTRAVQTLRQRVPGAGADRVFKSTQNALRLSWEHARHKAHLTDLRFHDLRHEAVSRLFEKGLNVVEVGTISGHKELRMLRRYTHLRASSLAERLG